ncbi:hypothetical protein DFJ74DRAFT_388886 [Hyaloraphidium curvatum]|nr:hypothetical protein DFJ74DRAFT_388886 [Hyaloraphidium curvatum]
MATVLPDNAVPPDQQGEGGDAGGNGPPEPKSEFESQLLLHKQQLVMELGAAMLSYGAATYELGRTLATLAQKLDLGPSDFSLFPNTLIASFRIPRSNDTSSVTSRRSPLPSPYHDLEETAGLLPDVSEPEIAQSAAVAETRVLMKTFEPEDDLSRLSLVAGVATTILADELSTDQAEEIIISIASLRRRPFWEVAHSVIAFPLFSSVAAIIFFGGSARRPVRAASGPRDQRTQGLPHGAEDVQGPAQSRAVRLRIRRFLLRRRFELVDPHAVLPNARSGPDRSHFARHGRGFCLYGDCYRRHRDGRSTVRGRGHQCHSRLFWHQPRQLPRIDLVSARRQVPADWVARIPWSACSRRCPGRDRDEQGRRAQPAQLGVDDACGVCWLCRLRGCQRDQRLRRHRVRRHLLDWRPCESLRSHGVHAIALSYGSDRRVSDRTGRTRAARRCRTLRAWWRRRAEHHAAGRNGSLCRHFCGSHGFPDRHIRMGQAVGLMPNAKEQPCSFPDSPTGIAKNYVTAPPAYTSQPAFQSPRLDKDSPLAQGRSAAKLHGKQRR